MTNEMSVMESRIAALEVQVKFMSSRMASDMQMIMEMFGSSNKVSEVSSDVIQNSDQELGEFRIQLGKMSPKQHVALQMVMDVRDNLAIAEVVGVQENSAKMYVKNVSSKMGLKFRGDLAEKARRLMEFVSDDEYLRMSKGIPKHWWRDRVEGEVDSYAEIYQKPRM
tara:strand:+ start:234 stop:734 length:501 start_codon:yes stop_codon:yes gene_type:complete